MFPNVSSEGIYSEQIIGKFQIDVYFEKLQIQL